MNHDDFKTMEDYWLAPIKSACISAAVEMNIFEIIKSEVHQVKSLALRLNLNEKTLEAFCNALAALGFLERSESTLTLTRRAELFLSAQSPFDRSDEFLDDNAHPVLDRIRGALKSGWDPLTHEGDAFSEMWREGSITEEAAADFTKAMQRAIQYPAFFHSQNQIFESIDTLTDVGGGSGAFAHALTHHHPHLQVQVFDLGPVLKTAETILKKQNADLSRIHLKEGNFFQDQLPASNAYLLSNILHDWPKNQAKQLLEQIRKAAPAQAKLFIHECILDEDRKGPPFTAVFNLLMAVNHQAQQFTRTELDELLLSAGFSKVEIVSSVVHYQLLISEKI